MGEILSCTFTPSNSLGVKSVNSLKIVSVLFPEKCKQIRRRVEWQDKTNLFIHVVSHKISEIPGENCSALVRVMNGNLNISINGLVIRNFKVWVVSLISQGGRKFMGCNIHKYTQLFILISSHFGSIRYAVKEGRKLSFLSDMNSVSMRILMKHGIALPFAFCLLSSIEHN